MENVNLTLSVVTLTRAQAVQAGAFLLQGLDAADAVRSTVKANTATVRGFIWSVLRTAHAEGHPAYMTLAAIDEYVTDVEAFAEELGARIDRKSSTLATLASEGRRIARHPMFTEIMTQATNMAQALKAVRAADEAAQAAEAEAEERRRFEENPGLATARAAGLREQLAKEIKALVEGCAKALHGSAECEDLLAEAVASIQWEPTH